MTYRAPCDGTTTRVALDAMVALFDRRAGVTHLLAEPAVTVLDALTGDDASARDVAARLGLEDREAEVLVAERLDELVVTGLVERLGPAPADAR